MKLVLIQHVLSRKFKFPAIQMNFLWIEGSFKQPHILLLPGTKKTKLFCHPTDHN